MAEQFIKAMLIDLEQLEAIVGGGEAKLVSKLLDHDLAEEVSDLLEDEDLDLEEVLDEIVTGELVSDHADGYRRSLELFATVLGVPIDTPEAILPGRGWQELGAAWSSWGQHRLAQIWGGAGSNNPSLPWPWTESDAERDASWPVALVIKNVELEALAAELANFDERSVVEKEVPRAVRRFGDPAYWSTKELARELVNLVGVLQTFVSRATKEGSDLLLWHDGQQ